MLIALLAAHIDAKNIDLFTHRAGATVGSDALALIFVTHLKPWECSEKWLKLRCEAVWIEDCLPERKAKSKSDLAVHKDSCRNRRIRPWKLSSYFLSGPLRVGWQGR